MEEEEARKTQAREATKAFFGGKPPVEDQDGGKSYSPTLGRPTSFD